VCPPLILRFSILSVCSGKLSGYEEDIRVPLIIRGPGLAGGGRLVDAQSANIDIAPTLLVLAGGLVREAAASWLSAVLS
jgi:arylsulfatase A-like enzyme